ncbi:MAG: hypothetical protein ACRDE2_04160 [Chitinophagaceae bacterium]
MEASSLSYRLDVIKRDNWNEQTLKEHQSNMINWFLSTFPLPEQYKEKTNWDNKAPESPTFSPLDTDAGEMAEGNKPVELYIQDEVIKVNSWQDVFIKFLKYLKDNPNFDFDFILDNQSDLFKRDETIVKWVLLKDLIGEKVDLSSRYKTFDGKVWDKVKELDDNLLFIHINISASNCMTRIGNIMNKFNMAESSVKINLK